jgi:hypothetical protein
MFCTTDPGKEQHMKGVTYAKPSRLCLAGLCAIAVLILGAAGSASGRGLLFLSFLGNLPYHLTGGSSKAKFETPRDLLFTTGQVYALAAILTSTLLDLKLEFLETVEPGGFCSNTSSSETVLMNLLGHLGFLDAASLPSPLPGVLLLVPSGFRFICQRIGVGPLVEEISGSEIGLITSPPIGVASTLLLASFKQSKGVPPWTTFLPGNELLTNQFEEGDGEHFGQEFNLDLHLAPGEGPFKLVLDA